VPVFHSRICCARVLAGIGGAEGEAV
jgi:hypothetical protein